MLLWVLCRSRLRWMDTRIQSCCECAIKHSVFCSFLTFSSYCSCLSAQRISSYSTTPRTCLRDDPPLTTLARGHNSKAYGIQLTVAETGGHGTLIRTHLPPHGCLWLARLTPDIYVLLISVKTSRMARTLQVTAVHVALYIIASTRLLVAMVTREEFSLLRMPQWLALDFVCGPSGNVSLCNTLHCCPLCFAAAS